MRLPHRFGRYLLQERIGGGGMATVYRATFAAEGGFEKEVALKVIRGELSEDPQFIAMFLDEARLSGFLDHPNIVQTFDFGQVDGVYFLAMELVRGRTLAAILETLRKNRLRLGTAPSLFVAKEVARALDYAHRARGPDGASLGIVHRDVSPQNVLVSREGHVKLADFGIAKAALRSQVTQPGRVRGKCSYMAPEQARGREVDARADVFALGVVLWECLTGRRLFDGPSDASVLLAVIEKTIPPPSQYVPGLPAEVDRLVLRLLARDPERRPTSGEAYRELADLAFRLARSPEDLDLLHLQQRLASATAAVSQPEIELSTWKASAENAYPWPVDPHAETIVSEEESLPTRPLTPDDPTRVLTSEERATQTLRGTDPEAHGAARGRGRAMVPVAIASAVGAMLGIAAIFAWRPWERPPLAAPRERAAEAPAANIASPQPAEIVDAGADEAAVETSDAPQAPGRAAASDAIHRAASSGPSGAAEVAPRPGDGSGSSARTGGPSRTADAPPPVRATAAAKPPDPPRVEAAEAPPPRASTTRRPAPPTQPAPEASRTPPEEPAPRAEAPAPGTLVLSTRLAEVEVFVDREKRETLSPLSPRRIEVPAGRRVITFRHGESGLDCSVSIELGAGERIALLLDAQGVFALAGLERRPVPCR